MLPFQVFDEILSTRGKKIVKNVYRVTISLKPFIEYIIHY